LSGSPPWPEGVGRVALARVVSPRVEAARRAAECARPVWLLAAEQTAARGRRGRVWRMGPGNFAATLLMRPAPFPRVAVPPEASPPDGGPSCGRPSYGGPPDAVPSDEMPPDATPSGSPLEPRRTGSRSVEPMQAGSSPSLPPHGAQPDGRGHAEREGQAGPADAALRSFVAALALHDALASVAPGAPLALKWPNDVLLDGGKVAGILLESRGAALLVGIGVNLAAAPAPEEVEPEALQPVSLAKRAGVTVAPAAFLDHLAPAFAGWEARLTSEGFAPLRDAWLARAARLGNPIRARAGREDLEGTFETIDAAGHLVIATASGRRTVAAAEVFL